MFESLGVIGLPLIAALLHPVLGRSIQRGTRDGVGLSVLVGMANVFTAVVFLLYLRPDLSASWSWLDALALANGVLFFFGQYFSIRSMKAGDIVVHSSALGFKILVVALCALAVGLEGGRPYLLPAAVLACVSVFLVAGGNLAGWREHRITVGLTLLACLFFGVNDFFTGWRASELGSARWLSLMMGASAIMSLGLLASRRGAIAALTAGQWKWIPAVGLTLGVQALLVNIAFSHFKEPTLSNVAYSTRGLIAVAFLYVLGERKRGLTLVKQIVGAVLMLLALYLALIG